MLWAAGFGVHAQPVVVQGDDVDAAMLEHVRAAVARDDVAEVIVASHDQQAFAPLLTGLAERGITASILGHAACSPWIEALSGVSFIDLRAVADLARSRKTSAPNECAGVTLLLRAMKDLTNGKAGTWVRKGRLRPQMTVLDAAFTPSAYGYRDLTAMVDACGPRLKMRKVVGDHELALTSV